MTWLFLAAAGAQETWEVPDGVQAPVDGPAVCMTPSRFKRYVYDSRGYDKCIEGQAELHDLVLQANQRALKARDIAVEEFQNKDKLLDEQVQTIATLEAKLARSEDAKRRSRNQRNVAWGISGGMILGAATTIVLVLGN